MRRLAALNVLWVVVAACAGSADVSDPGIVTAPIESGTASPKDHAATPTTHPQVKSGSASTSDPAEDSFVTVGDGGFFGRVVNVEFGDDWAIAPTDVAVTPGAKSGTTVGPATLYFDDGTSLEVPAGTPGGNACLEYLGHHDPGFTLRTYAHLMPDSEDRARTAIDAALGAPAESSRNAKQL